MLRNTNVISISLPPDMLTILEQLARQAAKNRSEVIRGLIANYSQAKSWEQIFVWGRRTKENFNICSEADILKIIND